LVHRRVRFCIPPTGWLLWRLRPCSAARCEMRWALLGCPGPCVRCILCPCGTLRACAPRITAEVRRGTLGRWRAQCSAGLRRYVYAQLLPPSAAADALKEKRYLTYSATTITPTRRRTGTHTLTEGWGYQVLLLGDQLSVGTRPTFPAERRPVARPRPPSHRCTRLPMLGCVYRTCASLRWLGSCR
jgi:hypothetical protein